MYKLGIDIGGTKVNMGLLDRQNNLVNKIKINLPENKDFHNVVTFICASLKNLLDIEEISIEQIQSCGIGIPGTVSPNGRIAIKLPNLGWENMLLADQFESMTGITTKLVQDSRAAAFCEYKVGNGQGKESVICVTLGTGIGTGIVMNGKIFEGALGCAGEIGHVSVVQNGRLCGCGQKGCLENYAAGKGIEITAKEVFEEEITTKEFFRRVEKGNRKALNVLQEVIELLGDAIVSMVNLISPNCLLFSGGMSEQFDLLIKPLSEYVQDHRYKTNEDQNFFIGVAAFNEDAPMIGAALVPQIIKGRNPKISASIMCADMLNIEDELKKLEIAGVDYLHCDIMDGHFVPNLMLSMEMLIKIRDKTQISYDIHLMTEKPENIIPLLTLKRGDIVSVHWESTPHVQRALELIKVSGAIPALALNPSTPIECVRELLPDVQMILIMSVNPGYAGQKIIAQSFDKITRMRQYLDRLGYQEIIIEVDGNCSFENVPKMYKAGADVFVVGSSSVFDRRIGIIEGTMQLRNLLKLA